MTGRATRDGRVSAVSYSMIDQEPFYLDIRGETALFKHAYAEKIPVMLKGPTGCGKTRFVERMAFELNRELQTQDPSKSLPLLTIPCHEDLTADDLKGRHLITGEYVDGPALTAVKTGGILYLDEIVEARQDTMVVVHPLADHRRTLTVEKLAKTFRAPDNFMLVISYNPGYQKKTKDLKQSTKQRFLALTFDYAPADIEQRIIAHESNVDEDTAQALTRIGQHLRNLKGKGLDEGASTRLLINAGCLIRRNVDPLRACEVAIIDPLTDDVDTYKSLHNGLVDLVKSLFP